MIVLALAVVLWVFLLGMFAGMTVAAFTSKRRLPNRWE